MKSLLLIIPLALLILSCDDLREDTTTSDFVLADNSIDTEFELGRALFYDKKLSINNSISCGSCHKQTLAFADNAKLSPGFENMVGTRNTMPIQNLGEAGALFWDGRESSIFNLVLQPVVNHKEMGISNLVKMTEKLQSFAYYRNGFRNVYGTEEVTRERISQSMTQFLVSINSRQTKFDKFLVGGVQLNAQELKGFTLFSETYDCNSCHQVQDPSGYIFAGTFSNIGLDVEYEDEGLKTVTNNEFDNGSFKIPSLRNVALTAPYMHDGRFETLDEVVDHYSTNIADNDNLDFRLRDAEGNPKQFNINDQDKKAIIAFLHTLTDFQMISDPDLSDPFAE